MTESASEGRARAGSGPIRRADPFPKTLWTLIVDGVRGGATDRAHRESSWARFVETYRQPIERALRGHLHTPALRARSQELVDEFFSYLAVGDVLATVDRARGSFRRFIQGVIRIFVLAHLRRESRSASLDDAVLAELGEVDDCVESADERAWFAGMVHAALEVLAAGNPRQARAIRLRYGIDGGDGVPREPQMPAAIAADLGATPHATHELLRRGKRELQKILARAVADSIYGGDGEDHGVTYARERKRLQERVEDLWPGMLGDEAPEGAGDG